MANPNIRLHLQVDGRWRPFVSIPQAEFPRLTTRPLRWLRYLGWCIYGEPGELRATTGLLSDYYYFSSRSARFLDINAIDALTHSSYVSDRITSFCQDIITRDDRCIVSQSEWKNCTACHIVPHCKGDEYIACLSAHLVEIGDIRNGVLLYTALHRPFGVGEMAFLQTPNRYLSPTDVPNFPHPAPPNRPRLTLQHIVPQDAVNSFVAPHNKDATLSSSNMNPSPYLLHFFYACAVLRRWGQPADLGLSEHPLDAPDIQAIYYDLSDLSAEDGQAADPPPVRGGTVSRPMPQNPSSAKGVSRPHPPSSSLEDMMDLVLSISTHEIDKDKVVTWLNDLPQVLV
ncbi:hypothetical protein B0H11DRAFT_1970603 [Mycena galericulata]|nr:hypothetical protein B0H11DRAFT_1970603 [Mycena galericulata]